MISEERLHSSICQYIKIQYPNVIFNSDLSGLYITNKYRAKQIKNSRSSNGIPDIMIFEPKYFQDRRIYKCGLFLEVKKQSPYKQNGELKSNDHLREQEKMLNDLNNRGYFAQFVWTFDMAKEIIDNYLN